MRGVYYSRDKSRKRRRRWYCQRCIDGTRKFLGYFLTESDAIAALPKLNSKFMV